jgi:hypothetical protein
VQEEFLKPKSSSFFLRDLWISRLLLAACGRTEAIYLYSNSLKLGTYTKFLLLLLLRYATMPLSLLPGLPARPPASQPASHRPKPQPFQLEAQQQVQKRKDHTTRSTRQGSYLSDDPCIMIHEPSSSSCNLTYYRKEQAQVGGRALTDAWSEPGYPLTMHI